MSNTILVQEAPEEHDEYLGVDEISAASGELSPDDKLKLGAIETIRRSGTEFAPGELIQEAVCRALAGDRQCPRNVPFIAFLVNTMRSIASHARKALSAASAKHGNPDGCPDPPTPEDSLLQKEAAEQVQAIYGHFEDDSKAQFVLMGWADGLRGKELREATDLDQPSLDYAIKRIRKNMRKLYPDGWSS